MCTLSFPVSSSPRGRDAVDFGEVISLVVGQTSALCGQPSGSRLESCEAVTSGRCMCSFSLCGHSSCVYATLNSGTLDARWRGQDRVNGAQLTFQ